MIPPVIADTGGLLRALARTPGGQPSFPEYEEILTSAAGIIVPGLVLAEVDYFLRADRKAIRKLVAEIFDPATRYEYELPFPADIARALELDSKFQALGLGLVDGSCGSCRGAPASVPYSDQRSARFWGNPRRPSPHARA